MKKIVILAAEETEYRKCQEYFPEYECVLMGVGAGNVIKTCASLPEGSCVVNIGYAGSNRLAIGEVAVVSESHRLVLGDYDFVDYANPLHLSDSAYPCYTANDFVTHSDLSHPALFDMELNYIAAFTPHIHLLLSIKVVSDNLSLDAYRNNAVRESGILSADEVWKRVRAVFDEHLGTAAFPAGTK